MRETVEAKAARYLAEHRITLVSSTRYGVAAEAQGDGSVYEVTYRAGRWTCSCPARVQCCHVVAAKLILNEWSRP